MRKNKFKFFGLIAVAAIVSGALASCDTEDKTGPRPTEYNVSFETYGGSEVAPQKVPAGERLKAFEKPTYEGYKLKDWYRSADLDGIDESGAFKPETDSVSGDMTLHAKWVSDEDASNPAAEHLVIFQLNGGSMDAGTFRSVAHGTPIGGLPTPILTNFTFDGWYTGNPTAGDFKGDLITAAHPVTGPLTLYAWWANSGSAPPGPGGEDNVWGVTFNASPGAINGQASIVSQVEKGKTIAFFPDARLEGYTLGAAWYTQAGSGGDPYTTSDPINGDITLHARWTAIPGGGLGGSGPWTVFFILQAPGTAPSMQTIDNNGYATRPESPTWPGNDFIGWYLADASEPFNFEATTITGNTFIYAQWEPEAQLEQRTVTFHLNSDYASFWGTSDKTVERNLTEGTSLSGALMPAVTDPPSHAFLEWNTQADGLGTVFTNGTIVDVDIQVYGKWQPKPQTVTFNLMQGSGEAPTQNPLWGTQATRPAEDPTRDDHDFDDWYADPSSGDVFDFGSLITEPTTIWARWTPVIQQQLWTVNYVLNNPSGTPPLSEQVANDEYATRPEDPTWDTYTFAGWFWPSDAPEPFDFEGTPIRGNITLLAKWHPRRSVTFDPNGGAISGQPPGSFIRLVPHGTAIGEFPGVTRSGHTQNTVGWLRDGQPVGPDYLVNTDITITAQWTQNWKLTLDLTGGGTVAGGTARELYPFTDAARGFMQGRIIGALSGAAGRPGFTFHEWRYGHSPFNPNTSYPNNATLEAFWRPASDGRVWEQRGDEGNPFNAVAFGGGLWVAVGDGNRIMWSDNDGANWHNANLSGLNLGNIYAVAFGGISGRNGFVAGGSAGTFARSNDGKVWTALPNGNSFSTEIRGIAWAPGGGDAAPGGWIAVGNNGRIMRADTAFGTTSGFTHIPTSGLSVTLNAVAVNGSTLVAVGNGGRMTISTTGGLNWTAIPNTGNASNQSQFGDSDIMGVAYGGGQWVAVGDGGKIARSNNGSSGSWSLATTSNSGFGTSRIRSVATTGAGGNNNWVAVGVGGRIAVGSAGNNWQAVPVGAGDSYSGNWYWRNAQTGFASGQTVRGVAFGNGIYMAVGDGGRRVKSMKLSDVLRY